MSKRSPYLSDNIEGFIDRPKDYRVFEVSFRRWLVSEIDSGRMNFQDAKERFKMPIRFESNYRDWQRKYSEEFHLSLPQMSSKELSDNKKLEARIKELEKQLEYAQIKNVALNTMIDIAETELKIPIRKKSGSKQ